MLRILTKRSSSLPGLLKSVHLRRYSTEIPNTKGPDAKQSKEAKSLGFTALCGAGLLVYFEGEKRRIEANRKLEAPGVSGTPKLGGPIKLTDQKGELFDSTQMKDKFMLVYFGFTHCPDVCPEELDKMSSIINMVKDEETNAKVVPVFITVDAERDGPAQIKEYLKDFHPSFIGLTGTKEEVRETARRYRVYYRPARTGGAAATDKKDYLVDHSIFFFLIDPEGNYVTHFGRDSSPQKCAIFIAEALHAWDLTH